jgi:centractin
MEVAGDDVTRYFQYQLRKNGITFHTTAELETIRMIKEKHCELKDKSPKDDDAGPPQQRSQYQYGQKKQDEEEFDAIRYELPDGKQLQIGSARYKAPEVLFNPALIGLEYRGVQYCVLDSIAKADLDLRKDLYHHILLSGGTTQIHNFGKRLLKEIQANLPEKTKIKIWAPQERTITTWIGGSLLSGLGGFRPMWIKKANLKNMATASCIARLCFKTTRKNPIHLCKEMRKMRERRKKRRKRKKRKTVRCKVLCCWWIVQFVVCCGVVLCGVWPLYLACWLLSL